MLYYKPLFSRLLIGLLFITASCTAAFSQTATIRKLNGKAIRPEQIDSIVARVMEGAHVEGVCISILNNNKPVFVKAYGYKNKPKGEVLDTSTTMYAASFSKAVFAYFVMRLVDRGVIDLDKPLYQYLPTPFVETEKWASLKEKNDWWKLITARICLSHRSGLPNIWWLDPVKGTVDTTGKNKIYYKPGTRYSYSGEGLKLLQYVIEQMTKRSLEDLAQEFVFQPLGMTQTSYIWQDRFSANLAGGHNEEGKVIYKGMASKPGAAGSMSTTIADYTRFVTAVMQGKGLSAKAKKEMLTPQIAIHSKHQFPTMAPEQTTENDKVGLSYGLGWGLLKTSYGPAFFKEGHDDYWRNYNINFPAKGTSIIIMSNSVNGEGMFQYLLEGLIGDHFTPIEWQGYYPYDAAKK